MDCSYTIKLPFLIIILDEFEQGNLLGLVSSKFQTI